jgi:hypothetical protein
MSVAPMPHGGRSLFATKTFSHISTHMHMRGRRRAKEHVLLILAAARASAAAQRHGFPSEFKVLCARPRPFTISVESCCRGGTPRSLLRPAHARR